MPNASSVEWLRVETPNNTVLFVRGSSDASCAGLTLGAMRGAYWPQPVAQYTAARLGVVELSFPARAVDMEVESRFADFDATLSLIGRATVGRPTDLDGPRGSRQRDPRQVAQ